MERVFVDGNEAVARAVKAAKPKVMAIYPITPQTPVVSQIGDYIDKGELECAYLQVESEHSAMSACCAASATGVRVFTATSSQGLAYMHEQLFIASGGRMPLVMYVANRTIALPSSLQSEHHDAMAARDTGWVQIHCTSAQDLYDTVIQAYRIAEDPRVLLPIMVCGDGFRLSHTAEPISLIPQEKLDAFVSEYNPQHQYLDPSNPMFIGITSVEGVMEYRKRMAEAMSGALSVIEEVADEFERLTGRRYGLVETYMTDDAEVLMVTLGSMTGTAKVAVNLLRKQGKRVGLLNLRTVRPFPEEKIREVCSGVRAIAVIERNVSVGSGREAGAMLPEVISAMYTCEERPVIRGLVAGIGGRDIVPRDFVGIADQLLEDHDPCQPLSTRWIGLRTGA